MSFQCLKFPSIGNNQFIAPRTYVKVRATEFSNPVHIAALPDKSLLIEELEVFFPTVVALLYRIYDIEPANMILPTGNKFKEPPKGWDYVDRCWCVCRRTDLFMLAPTTALQARYDKLKVVENNFRREVENRLIYFQKSILHDVDQRLFKLHNAESIKDGIPEINTNNKLENENTNITTCFPQNRDNFLKESNIEYPNGPKGDYETNLAAMRTEMDSQAIIIRELNSQLSELRSESSRAGVGVSEEIESLGKENQELLGRIKEAERQIDEQTLIISRLNSDCERYQAIQSDLEHEIATLKNNCESRVALLESNESVEEKQSVTASHSENPDDRGVSTPDDAIKSQNEDGNMSNGLPGIPDAKTENEIKTTKRPEDKMKLYSDCLQSQEGQSGNKVGAAGGQRQQAKSNEKYTENKHIAKYEIKTTKRDENERKFLRSQKDQSGNKVGAAGGKLQQEKSNENKHVSPLPSSSLSDIGNTKTKNQIKSNSDNKNQWYKISGGKNVPCEKDSSLDEMDEDFDKSQQNTGGSQENPNAAGLMTTESMHSESKGEHLSSAFLGIPAASNESVEEKQSVTASDSENPDDRGVSTPDDAIKSQNEDGNMSNALPGIPDASNESVEEKQSVTASDSENPDDRGVSTPDANKSQNEDGNMLNALPGIPVATEQAMNNLPLIGPPDNIFNKFQKEMLVHSKLTDHQWTTQTDDEKTTTLDEYQKFLFHKMGVIRNLLTRAPETQLVDLRRQLLESSLRCSLAKYILDQHHKMTCIESFRILEDHFMNDRINVINRYQNNRSEDAIKYKEEVRKHLLIAENYVAGLFEYMETGNLDDESIKFLNYLININLKFYRSRERMLIELREPYIAFFAGHFIVNNDGETRPDTGNGYFYFGRAKTI